MTNFKKGHYLPPVNKKLRAKKFKIPQSYVKKDKPVDEPQFSPAAIVSKMSGPVSDKPLIRQYSSKSEKAALVLLEKERLRGIPEKNLSIRKGKPGSYWSAIKNSK